MKKFKKVLSLVVLTAFLAACANKVDESTWELVEDDISLSTVEELLGNPNNIITNKNEMIDIVNEKINTAKDVLDGSEIFLNDQLKEPLIRSIEAHETIRWGIETDSNIKILQYEVENSDNIKNIYFLDDRVFFYDGALE